jgi:hypothetical protein
MVSVGTGETPGGWITLPGGTFEVDPTSNIDRGNGTEGISYDRAFNRWVPADWNHISPDGRRYVAMESLFVLNIVDIATGAKHAITMPQLIGWSAIDWTANGIYLRLIGGDGPGDLGLWVMNPDSGQVRKLDGTQYWSHVDARAAWGTTVGANTYELRRLDLQTGAVTTQLAVPSHEPVQPGDRSLELISIDAEGRPLVLVRDWQQPYPWHMALLVAPNSLREVSIPSAWAAGWPIWENGDPYQSGRGPRGYALSRGIWMIGRNSFSGLALLGSDGVVRQLATGPDNIFAIAGGCH